MKMHYDYLTGYLYFLNLVISINIYLFKYDSNITTYHFKLLFHSSCNINGLLFHVFYGKHSTFINADCGEY